MHALRKSGPDQRLEMVEPGGVEEERLGAGPERLGASAQDEPADVLRLLRSAGLARRRDPMAERLEPPLQARDLGRLAGPLPALEGDEAPPHQPRLRIDDKARRNSP